MLARATKQSPFTLRLVAVSILSWLALTVWSVSPFAPYLNHEVLEHLPFTLNAHYVALLLIFVGGWILMVCAMMLPTILPFVTLFHRQTLQQSRDSRALLLLITGYVSVWTLFGGLAHFADLFVHEASHRFAWLGANPWIIIVATLVLAGLYQFTRLKRACLSMCRSPSQCMTKHGQSRPDFLHSAWLGVRHGLICVGCCWPLMLLMFAVACGNVAGMVVLSAVMAVEKLSPWGERMRTLLGAILLEASMVLAVATMVMG